MFERGNWDERVDLLEQRVIAKEAEISRLRAEQVVDLRELDRYQIDTADGARTMGDWVAAHLDLSHQTSSRLMQLAQADDPEIDANLSSGKWGLDRSSLLVKLRGAGASAELFSEAAERYSLGRLYGLVDRMRHLSPGDEQDTFEYRYLVVQPNLDESAFKLCSSTRANARGEVVRRASEPQIDQFGEGEPDPPATSLTSFASPTVVRLSAPDTSPIASLGWRKSHRLIWTSGGSQHPVRDPLHRQGESDRHRR